MVDNSVLCLFVIFSVIVIAVIAFTCIYYLRLLLVGYYPCCCYDRNKDFYSYFTVCFFLFVMFSFRFIVSSTLLIIHLSLFLFLYAFSLTLFCSMLCSVISVLSVLQLDRKIIVHFIIGIIYLIIYGMLLFSINFLFNTVHDNNASFLYLLLLSWISWHNLSFNF